ncbi:MAG: hypothetical protein ACRD19_13580 [Terriglobia bacterium]
MGLPDQRMPVVRHPYVAAKQEAKPPSRFVNGRRCKLEILLCQRSEGTAEIDCHKEDSVRDEQAVDV